MSIVKTIGSALKNFYLKNKLLLISVPLIVFLFFLNKFNYNRYVEQKKDTIRAEYNFTVAQDSLRKTIDKAGAVEYDKLAYLAKDVADLKRLNAALYEEVKATKGQVKVIANTGAKIVHDTVPLIVDAKENDSIVTLTSSYDKVFSQGNYRSLSMKHLYDLRSKLGTGEVTKDSIGLTAVVGLKQTSAGYEIFVKPKYPNMEIISLEGAVVDKNLFQPVPPKKKVPIVTLGGSVGWTPMTYDFGDKKFEFKPKRIGGTFGLNFNLVEILKRQ